MAGKDFYRLRGQQVVKALIENEFEALYCDTGREAVDAVLKWVPGKITVGIGGSITIRDLGLAARLKSMGCRVYDVFEEGLTPEEKMALRRKQITADLFLSSTNAVTLQGQLVNTDSSGNRVASMIFGPRRVIVVAGINKIVTNLEAALDRIKSLAAPQIARYLGFTAPCAGTGICKGCFPADNICRVTTVIDAKPGAMESFLVVLVGEPLGF
ncbi:MAG: lactate utilization protein [Firmicutes bacterium]|nr:lactate utilization protein [Bacillota bacterium]